MGQVVRGGQPRVPAASQAQAEQWGVSAQAIDETLHPSAWCVAAELVRDAARPAAPVLGERHAARPPLVPGYRTHRRDGPHRGASAQRLAERRRTGAAPWPGQRLGVLAPPPRLATEGVWCEDGHAPARSVLGQGRPVVTHDDVWRAERHFGTVDLLGGSAARGSGGVLRQPGPRPGTVGGSRPDNGPSAPGTVYAHRSDRVHAQGDTRPLRRLPVAVPKPPRAGDTALHLLRHVPRRHARAQTRAARDGTRWTLATRWQAWTATWTCAVQAWGDPNAALLGFGLAVLAYTAVAVLKAAWRAVHGGAQVHQALSRDSLA
jgi:hypothetical protein